MIGSNKHVDSNNAWAGKFVICFQKAIVFALAILMEPFFKIRGCQRLLV